MSQDKNKRNNAEEKKIYLSLLVPGNPGTNIWENISLSRTATWDILNLYPFESVWDRHEYHKITEV